MNETCFITQSNIIRKHAVMRNEKVEFNNEIFVNFAAFIKALYKKEAISYPKFYKMDNLSKLGFLGAEMLLKDTAFLDRYRKEDWNRDHELKFKSGYRHGLQRNDQRQIQLLSKSFCFVYTLPNILIGEICIRHKIKGENAFLISEKFDPGKVIESVKLLLDKDHAQACLCGWVEVWEISLNRYFSLLKKKKL